jgi:signal transduction histidine kinase
MQVVKSTFNTAKVNRLIGGSFAGAAFLLTAESTLNFISQKPFFNQPVAWTIAAGLWLTTLLFSYSYWFGAARPVYLKIHALYMFVVVILWPLMLSKPIPTDGHFYPWVWWAVDTGWLAAAVSFQLRWAISYFIGLNLLIQFMFSLPVGGSHSTLSLVTDFLFTILTNGAAAVIALLLRSAAEDSDRTNAEAIESAVLQARTEAAIAERERLDALVHDRVLTALISASMANNQEEAQAASDLAKSALKKLNEFADPVASQTVYTNDMITALVTAAKNIDPKLTVNLTESDNWQVDSIVASGLTEATLQAIQNSVVHAGPKASRELFVKTQNKSIKIVIRDNGKGFRPNRIASGRLGIKVSIVGRVEAIGGTIHIASAPGKGATIVMEWGRE